MSNRVIKTVFEMTSHERKYSGYTPIDGFRGKNQADLKNKIDEYLEKLIDRINEPLSDCPRCNGLGVVVKADG